MAGVEKGGSTSLGGTSDVDFGLGSFMGSVKSRSWEVLEIRRLKEFGTQEIRDQEFPTLVGGASNQEGPAVFS